MERFKSQTSITHCDNLFLALLSF